MDRTLDFQTLLMDWPSWETADSVQVVYTVYSGLYINDKIKTRFSKCEVKGQLFEDFFTTSLREVKTMLMD